TLRPAFPGTDRQELLHQIGCEEPRPPRRWNPRIPAELQTIVLKTLAKSPAERYTTAQELADDLRRFLENRPIKARQPTAVQVAWKWVRRHRGLVAAAVGLALTALAAVAGFFFWEQRQTQAALGGGAAEQDKTKRALQDLAAEGQRTKRALARKKFNSYLHCIALAQRELEANNVTRVDKLLDDCPSKLRHWEWHYLKRQCRANLLREWK